MKRAAKIGIWLLLVFALSAMATYAWRAKVEAEKDAAREREAAEVLRGKFTVAIQRAETVAAESQRILDGDAVLKAEIKRLEAAVKGKVKIVTIREGTTAPAPARGVSAATLPGCPECLVPVGSLLMARVTSLDAKTEKGNLVALTHVVVDRVLPEPRTTLLDDTLSVPASSFVTEAPPPSLPRWSFGGRAWWKNPRATVELNGGWRISGALWLDAAARFDNQYAAGLRWDIR